MMMLMFLLVWSRDRSSWENLCFSITVFGVVGLMAFEMVSMHTESPEVYGGAAKWTHLVYAIGVAGALGFVHFYFGTSKRWLLGLAIGLRFLAVVANFTTGQCLHLKYIHSLQKTTFLGEQVSVLGDWEINRWVLLGQFASLVQLWYVVDASIRLWRTGSADDKKRAVVVGGTLAVFIIAASGQSGLVAAGVLKMPFIVSIPFFGLALAMCYELSRDVLRSARLSRELQESERRMALAAGAANLGIWIRDLVKNEIWATDQWRGLLGFEKLEQINFDGYLKKVHPKDRENLNRVLSKAIESKGHYETEYRVVIPEDRIRWIASRGQVESNKDGKPLLVRGVSMDITALKQAEEKFPLVVEASPNGIVLVNSDGEIVLVNAETEKLFGYGREELIGQVAEMLMPERFRVAHQGHRAGYFALPAARPMGTGMELFALRKNGVEFPIEIGLSPIQTKEGTLVLAAIVDITARIQSEFEIQHQRAELAHVARVSTMGELAASVAHELNQPLGAILANAEAADLFLSQDPPALSELRDILADIRRDDERASEVIRRMRALLRKHEMENLPLEINSVVEDVLQVVSGDIALRKMSLGVDLAPGLPKTTGDRIHLQQVLLNLIINGMDAMVDQPRERRRIAIRTRLGADRMIELSVSDLGHGIEVGKSERLFEPFFTSKPNGMGMGLSIARTIVQAHHGRIWAESNSNGGATFRVTLPVAPAIAKL